MNLKQLILLIILLEQIIQIKCITKKKHNHHHNHLIISQSSIPQSLTAPIIEENYNPEESMCIWKDDLDNIYNLSLLQKTDSFWEVDLRTTEQQSFKIQLIFNFCNNFPSMPCSSKSIYNEDELQSNSNIINNETNNNNNNNNNLNYGAYQTLTFKNHQSMDSCTSFGQYDKSLIELIDYYEVGQGIKIVYRGGDICTQSENPKDENKPKSITFLIYCSQEKEDNFNSLSIDGISVTSCHPVLQIRHPGGCFQGQMTAQKHKLSHPILVFITLLILFAFISIIAIITAYNWIENGIKGFNAIPFYNYFKRRISSKYDNSI